MKYFIALIIAVAPLTIENSKPKLEAIPRLTLQEALVKHSQSFGIELKAAQALVDVESRGDINAVRKEPNVLPLAYRLTDDHEEAELLASSHCATQVLGINAHRRGVSIAELYEPETCVLVGLAEFARCRDIKCTGEESGTECLWKMARCYNGGPKSKSLAAKQYAHKLVRRYLSE